MPATNKTAIADHPIHEYISRRWSPYGYSERPVSQADLQSLFEAARWAPSSRNEQPWSYIVATKDTPEEFERILSCLVEANQVWAKRVPVLALSVASLRFAHNGRENQMAGHDLGLAAGNLLFEAMSRGLAVHQMAGILPEKARETYGIPEGFAAWTGLAIGYVGSPEDLPENLRGRDSTTRQRKKLSEFVFTGKWGQTSAIVRPD
jgi:nitroreductase